MNHERKVVLRLCNPRNAESVIAFIEEMSGEKLTPDEIEEIRQLIDLHGRKAPT